MSVDFARAARVVAAVHGRQETSADPGYQAGLADDLRQTYGQAGLIELYGRFAAGDGFIDALMRKTIWQSLARRCGAGLKVGSGAGFKHAETFEIGNGVFIGAQANIQGRYDGTCVIGDNVWIGGGAVVCPNVTIGDRCVIGAGSVVTKSIPAGMIAAGNPCRVLREA